MQWTPPTAWGGNDAPLIKYVLGWKDMTIGSDEAYVDIPPATVHGGPKVQAQFLSFGIMGQNPKFFVNSTDLMCHEEVVHVVLCDGSCSDV